MNAATPDRIPIVLDRIRIEGNLRSVSPVQAVVLENLATLKVDVCDVASLSTAFLDQSRANVKGILGVSAYHVPSAVDFLYLPVNSSIALTIVENDRASIILSLGLVEVLRLGCVAGHLESSIGRLEMQSNGFGKKIGATKVKQMVRSLRTMTQYLNACAVLHFMEPGVLPNAAASLDVSTQRRVGVTLEAVVMFVLLHELGHVDFRRRRKLHARDSVVWEFAVPEDLDANKEEELHADKFALQSVPPAFSLSLVHSATFFLHLHCLVDVALGHRPVMHPLSVNRISALYAAAKSVPNGGDLGHEAVSQAIAAGTQFWTERGTNDPNAPVYRESLRRFVLQYSEVDWRPVQEALLLLTSLT